MKIPVRYTTIKHQLIALITITTLIRLIIAAFIEFGNDEVYYHTYALYPALSYFDHPAMTGWLAFLSTAGFALDTELFMRLPAIILSALNTYLIYKIGSTVKNHRTGLYAAYLYTASIYCTIICGIFFMPDAPLSTFYLLASWLIIKIFKDKTITSKHTNQMLLLGAIIGLATLSKYHAIYLWGVIGLIIIFGARKWFGCWQLYASFLLTILTLLPIIIWNIQNDWISFAFHGNRVQIQTLNIDPSAVFREIFGGMGYHNPVNWILIIVALIFTFKGKLQLADRLKWILLSLSLPMILIFLFISIFRDTLPHWSGVGYMSLLVISAAYLDQINKGRFPIWIKTSLATLAAVLILALVQIKTGFLPLGSSDPTLDMYGWRKLETKVQTLLQQPANQSVDAMISYRWFPGAHIDYYVARPLGLNMYVIGSYEKIHEYRRINALRGMTDGQKMLYLAPENDFYPPEEVFEGMYSSYTELEPIQIERMGKIAKTFRVYILEDFVFIDK